MATTNGGHDPDQLRPSWDDPLRIGPVRLSVELQLGISRILKGESVEGEGVFLGNP